MSFSLRDAVTLDGIHSGRIVGISARDYNVEKSDGGIEANVKVDRLRPRAAVEVVKGAARV